MRLLNKLLGKEKPEIEKFSEDNYINKFGQIGLSRKQIRDAIIQCNADSKQEGTDNLPENFGD